DTITIERVLFGRNQEQRTAWRMELRDALKRTRIGSASTEQAPGEIGVAIRAQAEVIPIRAPEAPSGSGTTPGNLWRYAAPYRGLAAMTEEDSDYFFGRTQEIVEVLDALAAPGRLPVLIGNSGVGKSSLAQAGVLAALKRQAWPEHGRANAWPPVFQN